MGLVILIKVSRKEHLEIITKIKESISNIRNNLSWHYIGTYILLDIVFGNFVIL